MCQALCLALGIHSSKGEKQEPHADGAALGGGGRHK